MVTGMDFRGKKVTILGLGREGKALARYLSQEGAEVTVSDIKSEEDLRERKEELAGLPLRFLLGGHPPEILESETILVSPGVPLEIPILAEAGQQGIPLESETRLFFARCPAPIIGITGSSGKTTTTALVGEMLRTEGFGTFVGGNIGRPLIDRLEEITPQDKVVLELSSFQLELMTQSPHIAAVLNITPNHLDRHPSMSAYIKAKANIVRYQREEDWAVLNGDDPIARTLAGKCPGQVAIFGWKEVEGAFLQGQDILIRLGGREQRVCRLDDIKLRGKHNIYNVMAASLVAHLAGANPQAMRFAIRHFTGIEHRLELVRELRGVHYYNDSIATSPERTVAALSSFAEPILLLAGGRDKGLPIDRMAELIRQKVRYLVLFGEAAAKIEGAVLEKGPQSPRPEITHAASMEEAVEVAAGRARRGEVVLLAPGCTSFDMYRDFAARGEHFKELVNRL